MPFCKHSWNPQAPKFNNPFGWIPDVKDWPKILFELLKEALIQAVIMVMMKLLMKQLMQLLKEKQLAGFKDVWNLVQEL